MRAVNVGFQDLTPMALKDRPHPSRLILGWCRGRPLHIVVADDSRADETIVITVYEPDPELWEPGFRRRRRPWNV